MLRQFALGAALVPALASFLHLSAAETPPIQHVLLLSVDGMHAQDLARYVASHPQGALAELSGSAVTYAEASCSKPSDSFPGLAALVTGGGPQSTGLWYDDAWDRGLYQPADHYPITGTHGAPPTPLVPGVETVLTESLDYDLERIDGGASMHGGHQIDPDYLPRDGALRPVYPHQIIQANTIFEVVKAAGGRTAWSDKHPAYEWVNGPSGHGVDDLFTPEVNSNFEADGVTPLPYGGPTNGVDACSDYDQRKVAAILREIGGRDHTGTHAASVPAVFGMNFQSVSVAQKVTVDGAENGDVSGMSGPGHLGIKGLRGGYLDASATPGPVVAAALTYVDGAIGSMVAALKAHHLYDSTLIIVTAKHGQSPIDPATLRMKKPVPMSTLPIVADPADALGALSAPPDFVVEDTVSLVWWQDNHATGGALNPAVAAGDAALASPAAMAAFGIQGLIDGPFMSTLFDSPIGAGRLAQRTPDIIVVTQPGVIYSGSKAKLAEHGGFSPDDTHVALLIANPRLHAATVTEPVRTTQVAPTILAALGLEPRALKAVREEGTPVLGGIDLDDLRGRRDDHDHDHDSDRDDGRHDIDDLLDGRGDTLAVSRVTYDGASVPGAFPAIFSDPTVAGVQGGVHVDHYATIADFPRLGTTTVNGLTTSFSSKSEGALMRSADGRFLTYMGYLADDRTVNVSNSETPAATLTTNTAPTFDRAVALIASDGGSVVTPEANAYSGDNPRAAVSVDGTQFYMVGNADSSLNKDGTGPGTTMGARYGTPGSPQSSALGTYVATDRPKETAKQHIKDSNFPAVGMFNGNLYVAKGSGGNGDDGVFQVHAGTGDGLPFGMGNAITPLFSARATDPTSQAPSPYTPFGFWFADASTMYVADEGYPNTDASGSIIIDPLAGLEKWRLVGGAWTLEYVIQDGLGLGVAVNVPGYPAPTTTYGLRNLAGRHNGDGTVTLFAITAQYSTVSGGEPDPTRLVAVVDQVAATTPASHPHAHRDRFVTLQASQPGEVFRGVAIAPRGFLRQQLPWWWSNG